MAIDKMQSNQMVNDAALSVLRMAARSELKDIFPKIDEEFKEPLRLFASNPSDALLNIAPNVNKSADGSTKAILSSDEVVGSYVATTINFQTGAVVGGSVLRDGGAFSLPSSTIGQFRRFALVYSITSNAVNTTFSAEAASVGALADPSTLFSTLDGIPIGYVDLEATAATAFKTAGSATSIIENSVGGTSRIFKGAASGGGGSGTGDTTKIREALANHLSDSKYDFVTPLVFSTEKSTLIDVSSTGTYAGKSYKFTAGSQFFLTKQLLDADFLNEGKDVPEIDFAVYWKDGFIDTAAAYQVSRNAAYYQTVTPSRIGETGLYYGNVRFDGGETLTALYSFLTAYNQEEDFTGSPGSFQAFAQRLNQITTLAQVVSSLDIQVGKLGSPSGNLYVSICNGTLTNPDLTSVVSSAAPILMSSISSGTITVSIPPAVLAVGNYYWIVLSTDSAYKSSYSDGFTELRIRGNGAYGNFKSYNGSTWSNMGFGMDFELRGRSLDLRLKVTSSAGSKELSGLGVFYGLEDRFSTSNGNQKLDKKSFTTTDNTNSFTLNFLPDPNLLSVFYVERGQVFKYGAFSVNGYTVTFPPDTFYNGGIAETVTLLFSQVEGNSFDNSDQNASAIAKLTGFATKTSAYTAIAGDRLLTDTSGGAFAITLPPSPAYGATVEIYDAAASWATNNLTVDRNGQLMNGGTSNYVGNIDGDNIKFIFFGGSKGWRTF